MIRDTYNKIKFAWQRVVRGYDDTMLWEFDTYFAQFIPAIKKFCEEELKQKYIHLNPKHKEIFETTLKLIENVKKEEDQDYPDKSASAESKFWEYFGRNINYYWN